MHVAFPRIIPRIMPPNHTRESYHESYPWFWKGRAKHTPKHTPETYLRNIPRIIPPDATRFAGHGIFGKGHMFLSGLQTIHSFKMFFWQGFQIYLQSFQKSPPSQHSIFDHLFFTITSSWLPSIHHFNILPHLCQGQLCATQQIDELMLVTRFFLRYGPRIQISPKCLIYLNPQMHYGGVIYIRSSHAIIKQL